MTSVAVRPVASSEPYGMTQNTASHLSVKRYMYNCSLIIWYMCAVFMVIGTILLLPHKGCAFSYIMIA